VRNSSTLAFSRAPEFRRRNSGKDIEQSQLIIVQQGEILSPYILMLIDRHPWPPGCSQRSWENASGGNA